MTELIEENYRSIIKRGLIAPKTSMQDFTNKLDEEVEEFKEAYEAEELADIILVCLNIAKHFGIDIEKELLNKIEINKNR
jgi:predicted house-cleaning noncanonical NTP pyrophosphatase (MazG superfamily)